MWKGSYASIQETSFRNCHAKSNGGAVSTTGHAFSECHPTDSPLKCGIRIDDSMFDNCSASTGGCFSDETFSDRFDIENPKLEIALSNLSFSRCRATLAGSAFSFEARRCPKQDSSCKSLTPMTGRGAIRLVECCEDGVSLIKLASQDLPAASNVLERLSIDGAGSCPTMPVH